MSLLPTWLLVLAYHALHRPPLWLAYRLDRMAHAAQDEVLARLRVRQEDGAVCARCGLYLRRGHYMTAVGTICIMCMDGPREEAP